MTVVNGGNKISVITMMCAISPHIGKQFYTILYHFFFFVMWYNCLEFYFKTSIFSRPVITAYTYCYSSHWVVTIIWFSVGKRISLHAEHTHDVFNNYYYKKKKWFSHPSPSSSVRHTSVREGFFFTKIYQIITARIGSRVITVTFVVKPVLYNMYRFFLIFERQQNHTKPNKNIFNNKNKYFFYSRNLPR